MAQGRRFRAFVWVFLFGILTSEKALIGLALTPLNVLITPIAHLLFGLTLALLAGILPDAS